MICFRFHENASRSCSELLRVGALCPSLSGPLVCHYFLVLTRSFGHTRSGQIGLCPVSYGRPAWNGAEPCRRVASGLDPVSSGVCEQPKWNMPGCDARVRVLASAERGWTSSPIL